MNLQSRCRRQRAQPYLYIYIYTYIYIYIYIYISIYIYTYISVNSASSQSGPSVLISVTTAQLVWPREHFHARGKKVVPVRALGRASATKLVAEPGAPAVGAVTRGDSTVESRQQPWRLHLLKLVVQIATFLEIPKMLRSTADGRIGSRTRFWLWTSFLRERLDHMYTHCSLVRPWNV